MEIPHSVAEEDLFVSRSDTFSNQILLFVTDTRDTSMIQRSANNISTASSYFHVCQILSLKCIDAPHFGIDDELYCVQYYSMNRLVRHVITN